MIFCRDLITNFVPRCLLQDDLDCSLESLTEFGLDFAFRKLKERNIEDAVLVMKNLVLTIVAESPGTLRSFLCCIFRVHTEPGKPGKPGK